MPHQKGRVQDFTQGLQSIKRDQAVFAQHSRELYRASPQIRIYQLILTILIENAHSWTKQIAGLARRYRQYYNSPVSLSRMGSRLLDSLATIEENRSPPWLPCACQISVYLEFRALISQEFEHQLEFVSSHAEKRWVVSKIPRGDTNGVGEDRVTIISGLHMYQRGQKVSWTTTRGLAQSAVTESSTSMSSHQEAWYTRNVWMFLRYETI